ncbi:glucosyl-3-phosphoglycerate synthase [Actinospica sp.]|uniref:glucosyl-3-phosphoglycerate synthase n=1 Tax=Actinospica sp. TaxID=1872142 RepID=UPI0032C2314E
MTRWARRHWSRLADWPMERMLAAKQDAGTTVSVVLPALNEQDTVGDIVSAIRSALVLAVPLVDEVVVVDSGSTDRTAEVAARAGALVVHRDRILPRIPARPGKGEVLWRSLLATRGDVLCFVDADLREFDPALVCGILGPLLAHPEVQLVKAAYDRPLIDGGTVLPAGGGRVTELVARPLLNLHWPLLAGIVQPLAGEYAARRNLLERLPFACGYGVEFGLLVDTFDQLGLDALAQVDVGSRSHRHQDDRALGRMSSEIWQTALLRLRRSGRVRGAEPVSTTVTQFHREQGGFRKSTHETVSVERQPMDTVLEYRERVRRAVAAAERIGIR